MKCGLSTWRTLTCIPIGFINTCRPVLAFILLTIVNINPAIGPDKSARAFTHFIAVRVTLTLAIVFALVFATRVNTFVAVFPSPVVGTLALVTAVDISTAAVILKLASSFG